MKKVIAPLVILAALVAAGVLILGNPPSSQRQGPPTGPQTVVEVMAVQPQRYEILINSYGTVQPRTQSVLVAQVSGQVVDIKANFRPGGFFQQGETLLTIDPRDYEADVQIAEASLMDALQAEAQERARAEQALTDWQRLGDGGEPPSDLVLRKPQLQAAQARVSSARSALTKAKLDLERTAITAPFSGRVLRQMVDVGQVVNPGNELGEVYATDYIEVRLPIRNADLAFMDLPEGEQGPHPEVVIHSDLGARLDWRGQIIRTEGAIDEVARQLHVVAQINDPFGMSTKVGRPLKIGEYVTAEIAGKTLPDVIVVPNNTIYQNSYVYLVEEGLLQRRAVEIAWQNGAESIVSSGLTAGAELVTTPLGQVTSGTRVRIAGQQVANPVDAAGAAPVSGAAQ
jgi:RND family efflux transporter MFP subunit